MQLQSHILCSWVPSLVVSLALSIQAFSQVPDSFNPGPSSTVSAIAVQNDSKVILGGAFGGLGSQAHPYIARVNSDGTVDSSFNASANGSVYCVAVQADGRVLLGGNFVTVNGQPRGYLARLNVDGTLDTNFNANVSSPYVYALGLQADGKILVGGVFSSIGGQARNCIGRLNPDGTVDSLFNPGASAAVYSLAIQPDGKILAGGFFTALGGQSRQHLGRLNPDGTLDAAFNPGADSFVYCVGVQPDDKILVGGNFVNLGGQTCSRFGRLNSDGTLDTNFISNANAAVFSLALQTDGKILVGGIFNTLNRLPRNEIGRFNADGSLDGTFNPGADNEVQSLAVQADGKVLAGGDFTTLGGQSRSRVGRLANTDPATQTLTLNGSNITWLRAGTSPEVSRTTFEVLDASGGWLQLGSGTLMPGGWQLSGISASSNSTIRARGFLSSGAFNASPWFVESIIGAPVVTVQPPSQTNNAGSTASLSVLAGGTAPLSYLWFKGQSPLGDGGNISGADTATLTLSNLAGADASGYFVVITNAFGSVTSLIATLTVIDPFITAQPVSQTVNPGQSASFNVAAAGTVPLQYQWRKNGLTLSGQTETTLAFTNLQRSDAGAYDVVVTSTFGAATSAPALLTINLATADSFDPGISGPFVNTLVAQPDGRVLAGGSFTALGGQPANYIGRLNADGTVDTTFNSGTDSDVEALALQTDGKILVAGYFSTLGGQPRSSIGRLNEDGTLDLAFNPGADQYVNCLALQPDGKILVGGGFTTLAGGSRSGLGRLNPDGTLDVAFNPSPGGTVYALAVQPDGKILVGGYFNNLAGQPRAFIGRLNSDGTLDAPFNPGANFMVECFALQHDGKILAGGDFTTLGGQPRAYLGRLNPDGTVDLNFTPKASAAVMSLAVQVDGRILLGGNFTNLAAVARQFIGRLNSDGTLDTTFDPGADGSVESLALQVDGKILAGGTFTTLGAQPRNAIGRLNNTDPAMENLSADSSTITWIQAGTGPEFSRTSFEFSTNGSDWLSLGAGARTPNGWTLTGVSLPPNPNIRARGFVTGGLHSGSTVFVESILPQNQPAIIVTDPNFGLSTNGFGFDITGGLGQTVVIESSSNLQYWTAVATNTVGAGPLYFIDSGPQASSSRFYRLRLWP